MNLAASAIEAVAVKRKNTQESWPTYKTLLKNEDNQIKLKKFEEIREHISDWFQYHQLFEKFKSDKQKGFSVEISRFESDLVNSKRKTLSKTYRLLLDWTVKEEEVTVAMVRWSQDFGHSITMAQWENLWKINWKFTNCYTIRENFQKMQHRWYLTPWKLSKMYKNVSSNCWRCGDSGTFYHMWWICRKIQVFWESIHAELQKMLKISFNKKPEAYLLGITDLDIPQKRKGIFLYATAAARVLIAAKWKSNEIPSIQDWIQKLTEYAELDGLSEKIKNKSKQEFVSKWEVFKEYLKNKYSSLNSVAAFEELQ